jgi:hypothetical protein
MSVITSNNIKKLAKIILALAEISKELGQVMVEPAMLKKFQRRLKETGSYSEQSLNAILSRVLDGTVTEDDISDLREISGEK